MKSSVLIPAFAALSVLLAACSPTIDEPLTGAQANEVLGQIEKPVLLAKFSLQSPADFEESYGDQEDVVQTFEDASTECAAVSDLEVVTRFAPGGSGYRKFLPTGLRGFGEMKGINYRLSSADSSDDSATASVGVAILAFESTDDAARYVEKLEASVTPCFDFNEEITDGDDFVRRGLDLMKVSGSTADDPSFRIETVSTFAFAYLGIDLNFTYDQITNVTHFGPNVVVAHSLATQGAERALGITNEELNLAISEIVEQIEPAMLSVLD